MDRSLAEGVCGLGKTHELEGLSSGYRNLQGKGIGHPDILRGEDHHAAGDELGILTRLEHREEPVEGGIRV